MRIVFESEYVIGLAGLVIGVLAGLIVGAVRGGKLGRWDARASAPLLLGAAGAHLALISAVEPRRQVLFALYGLALIGVVAFAALGWSIWRLGGVVFPAGSIAAYFYFAIPEHQADYIGLLVKLVEVVAIVAVAVPLFSASDQRRTLAV